MGSHFYTAMYIKPIFVFSMLYTTSFGALKLLKDLENFKRDLLKFIIPTPEGLSPSLRPHPTTEEFDWPILCWNIQQLSQAPIPRECRNLLNQDHETVISPIHHHQQFEEVSNLVKPTVQQPDNSYLHSSTLRSVETTNPTLFREDLLNRGRFHDKKQREDSGNCVGNNLCSHTQEDQ